MPEELQSRPADHEIEVSLIGPGFGECVVIHLGGGRWAVVDSCIDKESKRAAALTYLERIGVDPADSVDLVVCTHWHDDQRSPIMAAPPVTRRKSGIGCSFLTASPCSPPTNAWQTQSQNLRMLLESSPTRTMPSRPHLHCCRENASNSLPSACSAERESRFVKRQLPKGI